jgi:hypothetical protein
MALFNFSFNTPSPAPNEPTKGDDNSVVILQYNAASVTIPAADAEGKTVEQLFEEYEDELDGADTSEATFMKSGQVVESDSTVKAGTVYRACITSDTKGA